jgi:ABC-type branched-subunit amino acid transport system ATPase component
VSSSRDGRLLEVNELVAGYRDDIDILRGISFHVELGELVAIIGPNGAGKSTLIKCLCGLVRIRSGTIELRGEQIAGLRPYVIVRRGIGYVPQRDNVFPRMTVDENLEIGAMAFPKVKAGTAKKQMLELFPALAPRAGKPAGVLSGGERQMLAMARALMTDPQVLLLDEPSAGVDPRTVSLLWERIRAVRERGVTTVLVEQNARQALAMADRGYVLDFGKVSFEGASADLLVDSRVAELYLGG